MQFQIYNPYDNKTVSEYYVSIIEEAIKESGNDTTTVSELVKCNKDIGVVTVAVADAIVARKKGYYPVILWVQGIIPEESFMRHHSRLRSIILSKIERRGLKAADIHFYISESMKNHFITKYHFESKNSYIMPCFNSEINKQSFFYDSKYSKNQFVYAGGLQAWQCFEQSVQLYSLIEREVPLCELRVLTKDKHAAMEVIKKYGIKHYSIGFVPKESIDDELAKSKFGFAIRETNAVNFVSTPTKLSSYISNGVLPIYTKAIGDFGKIAKHNAYCICVDYRNPTDAVAKLVQLCKRKIDAEDVFVSFSNSFSSYYSKSYHINNIRTLLSSFHDNT